MSEAIPQDEARLLQLAAIGGDEPASSYFELRPLGRDGRPGARSFVPVRELDQAAELAIRDVEKVNSYVGAAPRTREDGTAGAVERVWVLWADIDGGAALSRLRKFRPEPSFTVRSGSPASVHAYWCLSKPVSPAGAQRANRRLALALGADMNATDPARILRAIGSLNHKHDPPGRVECVQSTGGAFKLGEVVGALPDSAHYRPRPPRPAFERRDAGSSLAGLARAVAEAQEGNRNACLYWAACCARDEGIPEHQATGELTSAALHAGLSGHEIERTIGSAFGRVAA